jgi:short-subunit dehydrogenase
MSSINNKGRVLITGASSGIGWHLALKFAERGHDLLLTGRNKDRLEEISSLVKDKVDVKKCTKDLSILEDVKQLAEIASLNGVSVLINNAAVICPGLTLTKLTIENINDMLDVNLRAPILLTKFLYEELDSIININSMVGLEIKKNRTLYSASKWGLRGFSQSLGQEYKDMGVNVLDVYPTNVRTWPGKPNSMDIEPVVENIYSAFKNREQVLILDGRKKDG